MSTFNGLSFAESGAWRNDRRCGAASRQENAEKEAFMSEADFSERMLASIPCGGAVEVPTRREQDALINLKAIKTRVRELKRARAESGDDVTDQRRDAIERELQHLKREWDHWEEERKEAARERMILLGHEEA
jgi:hypothetical protein